jgi:SAM-dependent methyltransferase
MDRDIFDLMAATEDTHWWFRGRRDVIAAALRRVGPPEGARILDAGCGSGGNLALLSRYGSVSGFEFDGPARAQAAARGVGRVEAGALPHGVPFGTQPFHVIGMFDVLEHLEQPVESLVALHARLEPGGALVLTVPAYQWLWGPHDVQHQHRRRYSATLLDTQLRQAGFEIEYLSYFNTLLLPLAIVQRVKERVLGYDAGAMPGSRVNELLYRIWSWEQAWIPMHRAPCGLSLLAIARR